MVIPSGSKIIWPSWYMYNYHIQSTTSNRWERVQSIFGSGSPTSANSANFELLVPADGPKGIQFCHWRRKNSISRPLQSSALVIKSPYRYIVIPSLSLDTFFEPFFSQLEQLQVIAFDDETSKDSFAMLFRR